MRIIAGEFRGRKLKPPASDATRPITDRVKQSVFDIISPYLPDAVVYDCFAGTGSMGLESLSRGAARAVFFEAERSALKLLSENIATLGVAPRCTVIGGDLFRFFADGRSAAKANVIFFDPPYRFLLERPVDLRATAACFAANYLAPEGMLVFRHDADDALDLPPLRTFDRREYGSMAVELLSCSNAAS